MILMPLDVDPERDVVISIAEGRLLKEMPLIVSDNFYGDNADESCLGEEEQKLQKFLLRGNKQWTMLGLPACYEVKDTNDAIILSFAPYGGFYDDYVMFISSSIQTTIYPLIIRYGRTIAFGTYIYSNGLRMGMLNLIAGLRFSKEVLEREAAGEILKQCCFSFELKLHFEALIDMLMHRSGKKDLSFSVDIHIYDIRFPLARGTISMLDVESYKRILCRHYLESAFIRKFHRANTIDEMVEAVEKHCLRKKRERRR